MQTIHIAPSILAADFTRLGEQIRTADSAGANWLHIDIMDGRFVPNMSMGINVVEAAKRSTDMPLDVHLMIVEPDHLLSAFAQAGATHINVHVEACRHLNGTLRTIKDLGCRAGVALNPHTPPVMISEVLHLVDVILVLTVNPGFGGQSFLTESLSKIRKLREMCNATGRDIDITVDGGVNLNTAAQCVEAGANVLVAGSAIFTSKHSVADGIERLRKSIQA